MLPLALVLACP